MKNLRLKPTLIALFLAGCGFYALGWISGFELLLGLIFELVFFVVARWQAPGTKLSRAEIEAYIQRLDRDVPLPDEEKKAFLEHLQAWGERDDGKPIYNLNLMRYFETLRQLPGVTLQAKSIPEANAFYEAAVKPMCLKLGVTMPFGGSVQTVMGGAQPSTNLITFAPELDNWSRVLIVRYPSRRAFFDLVSNPEYLKVMPYKLSSLMVVLTPIESEVITPDVRLLLGSALLSLFLLIGWVCAA